MTARLVSDADLTNGFIMKIGCPGEDSNCARNCSNSFEFCSPQTLVPATLPASGFGCVRPRRMLSDSAGALARTQAPAGATAKTGFMHSSL
jgi:hypothetical protein